MTTIDPELLDIDQLPTWRPTPDLFDRQGKLKLSPVEAGILGLVRSSWMTVEELQGDLYPEIRPESVVSAVRFLRRRNLLAGWGIGLASQGYHTSPLGEVLLGQYHRELAAAHVLRGVS